MERLLGTGNTSTVWLAGLEGTAQPEWNLVAADPPGRFALKVPRDTAQRTRAVKAAVAELEVLESIRHPHLVRAYGVLDTSHGLGLMLEAFNVGSVGALLRRTGKISLGQVVTLITPISTALAHLHARDIIHGDVSPGNILLAPDGRPALSDLADSTALGTRHGVGGTPGFMAPEAVIAQRVAQQDDRRGAPGQRELRAQAGLRGSARTQTPPMTPASDVYSLAAVAWCALTAAPPAKGDRRAPLRSLRPELPERVSTLLEWALSENPESRPSAHEFGVSLFKCARPETLDLSRYVEEEVLPELPTGPRNQGQWHKRSRVRRQVAAACVGVLVLTGLGIYTGSVHGDAESELPDVQDLAAQGPAAESPAAQGPAAQPTEEAAEPEPGSRAESLLRQVDPVEATAGIAELRTEALRRRSLDLVNTYTAADSPAREADSALLMELMEQQLHYTGEDVEITVHRTRPGGTSGTRELREARLTATVTASGIHSQELHSQSVLLVLQRDACAWLLYAVEEPPANQTGSANAE